MMECRRVTTSGGGAFGLSYTFDCSLIPTEDTLGNWGITGFVFA